MEDFANFKRMITPVLIQMLFWLAVLLAIGIGLTLILETERVAAGLALLIGGPVVARIYAELMIVVFRINETLTDISNQLASDSGW